MEEKSLILFGEKEIRKVWYNEEWYFSVVDIVGILSDSSDPSNYWTTVKLRDTQLPTICRRLKLLAVDGKKRLTDCANTEGVFRIIMSIPSPKAEPLKLWLAQLGKERIEETENPELSFERMSEIYRAKGHTEEWIKNRLQAITTRKYLTDEWKNRGVNEGQEYGILTATIAKGTFGLTPSEHGQLKGLDKQNLRDHMTPMELILTAFSEEATRQIAIRDEALGFNENHEAAILGGQVGGKARLGYEQDTGLKVISTDNFLNLMGDPKDALPLSDDLEKEKKSLKNKK